MEFKPGLYVHHETRKLYRALALVARHDTQLPMVLYVALEYPTSLPQVREWDWGGSSWTDIVGDDGSLRFQWVGP